MKKRCARKSLILVAGFLVTCLYPVTYAKADNVYYCEVLESIFIKDHQAARSNIVGQKFKMEVVVPKIYPGGSLRFSENSPINRDFHIVDSWGGVDKKFLALDSIGESSVLHFFEGYLTYVDIADLSAFGGPVLGATTSAQCDKF